MTAQEWIRNLYRIDDKISLREHFKNTMFSIDHVVSMMNDYTAKKEALDKFSSSRSQTPTECCTAVSEANVQHDGNRRLVARSAAQQEPSVSRKPKVGKTVKFKNKKWIVAWINGDKAHITLKHGEKVIWRGMKTIDSMTTKLKNLIVCD